MNCGKPSVFYEKKLQCLHFLFNRRRLEEFHERETVFLGSLSQIIPFAASDQLTLSDMPTYIHWDNWRDSNVNSTIFKRALAGNMV